MGLVNSSLSSQSILPMGPKPKVIESAPIETLQTPEKPIQSKESFDAARLTQVGKGEQVVNASQTSQQIKQGIDQADSGHLLEQSQTLLQSSVVSEEFGLTIPKAPPLPPPPKPSPFKPSSGSSAITADMLVAARQKLKTVSQHQVLNLGDLSTGSTAKESTVSRKLGSEVGGVPLDRDTLPSADGTIDIVGHSSDGGMTIEGRNPQQLAQLLKDQYGLQQIQTIHLVSCKSEAFKAEFKQALADLGVEVGTVDGAKGNVAVDRATGKTLDDAVVGDLGQIEGHDGELGKYTIDGLLLSGRIDPPQSISEDVLIVPFKKLDGPSIHANTLDGVSSTVGAAVKKAYEEFGDGKLLQALDADKSIFGSGHLAGAIQMLENQDYDLLHAKVGYLIEDRVTQILIKEHKFNKSCFQQVDFDSRPDIVLGPSREIRVDITASASVGHILDKDSRAWFSDGLSSMEVIYTSVTIDDAKDLLSGKGIDLSTLREAKKLEKAASDTFNSSIVSSIQGHIDTAMSKLKIVPTSKGLTQEDKRLIAEEIATNLGVETIDVIHTLRKYKRLNVDELCKRRGGEGFTELNQACVLKTVYKLSTDKGGIKKYLYPSRMDLHLEIDPPMMGFGRGRGRGGFSMRGRDFGTPSPFQGIPFSPYDPGGSGRGGGRGRGFGGAGRGGFDSNFHS